ncbi:hypothetical protein ACQKLN_20105 [Paenibacillus glucanolyticus]
MDQQKDQQKEAASIAVSFCFYDEAALPRRLGFGDVEVELTSSPFAPVR